MAQVRYVFHPGYDFNRGVPFAKVVHGFVLNKPSQIRAHLLADGAACADDFERPEPAREEQLSAIHSETLLRGLRSARSIAAAGEFPPLTMLPAAVARHILVKPQLRACGGTSLALMHAARGDWVFNTSGGFHHARPNLSHGFCLVNDVAWAVHNVRESGGRCRILVLDLDLHQGDGNAVFFANDPSVFTASLHQENTFPTPKPVSDLDLGLVGAVGDTQYLEALDTLLEDISARFTPDVVVFVAGTDPYKEDAIGDFALSANGLRERDLRVARFTREMGAGLVALPAGGYSARSPRLSATGFAAMARDFTNR